MAQLKNIIKALEQTFKVHVHGSFSTQVQIENVQYLLASQAESLQFQKETLYIGNYKELHSYDMDACVLLLGSSTSSGNENGMYIYHALDPFLVCNCIQQELFLHHQVNLKKEEMFQVLQAGYGIQSILDTARSYLKNPITLCTTSFSVLAISPKQYLDDKFDLSNTKRYLKKNYIENMKDIQILQHIFSSHYPVKTCFVDSPGVEYLFCSIHIKHAAVGYICLHSAIRPFEEEDESFVMDLCKMLSIEMQKDDFYTEKTGLKYEYFLTDLLEGNIPTVEFAAKRMEQLGHSLHQYFWMVAFRFNGLPTNRINPKYYIDQLLDIFKNSMVLFYKGTLVMLLSGRHPDMEELCDRQKLEHFLQFNHMNYSVSYRFENILDSPLYYDQAMFLLELKSSNTIDRCIPYGRNFMSHLFESAGKSLQLSTQVHPDVRYLSEYDIENKTEYIHTLDAFFKNNRNALAASKALHIHKSTFFYRLGKIAELTDFSMEDARSLFTYEYSLILLNYLHRQK